MQVIAFIVFARMTYKIDMGVCNHEGKVLLVMQVDVANRNS